MKIFKRSFEQLVMKSFEDRQKTFLKGLHIFLLRETYRQSLVVSKDQP